MNQMDIPIGLKYMGCNSGTL